MMLERNLFQDYTKQDLITTITLSSANNNYNIKYQSMSRKTRRRRAAHHIDNNFSKINQNITSNHKKYSHNCHHHHHQQQLKNFRKMAKFYPNRYSIFSLFIVAVSLAATQYIIHLSEATTTTNLLLGSQLDLKSAGATAPLLTADTIDKHQPKAEALKQEQSASATSTSNSNVIIIKYANVTKSNARTATSTNTNSDESDNQAGITTTSDQYDDTTALNVFKLTDEPLSVSVIESKFAHSIQLFDVSQNQLSTLSNNLFCPLSNEVRLLNVSHNLLENFDSLGLISQTGQLCLNELRILDMSFNLIKHLPATGVASLHNLEILNLSNNLIETLDELSLSSLFRLTKLDLSYNRIQQLPLNSFQKSYSMQVLKLQSNQLQITISQTFLSGMNSLEELDLSQNNISQVSDSAFLDKINLTRVDLRHNKLTTLRQDALRVTTSIKQVSSSRHRLHHNGQYAGTAPKQSHSQSVSAEFFISSNPFICDCQLEWIRSFQSQNAIKTSVLSSTIRNRLSPINHHQTSFDQSISSSDQYGSQLMQLTSGTSSSYQNDQPSVISAPSSSDSSNNISEILAGNQALVDSTTNQASHRPMATLLTATASQQQQQQQHVTHHYARIGDINLTKCTPLFRRNTHRYDQQHNHNNHHHDNNNNRHRNGSGQSRALAPSDGGHHTISHNGHQSMIDLLSADSSNFLCRYKSHCFALCHCCEFDACDCEMICPNGCNCYYDSTWKTNIIDCSSNNHTVVPDRIPMDVTGLYLDGNNIDSLKPSNLIARKNLKSLYLNSTNLQYIANRTFNGLIELQSLYLNDNMLRSLNGYEFEPLAQLKALYLQSNRLDHISNQTFIYLRSLEILDLSNNRLTSSNLDLFWSIGHHNIRLRQLNIAHNWWSCQCNSINKFRQILKQKFLLNGSVNIADKNQLRCYYNSTTVGPLILAEGTMQSQPLYISHQRQQQQTLLTEINQCSDIIDDSQRYPQDINPPLIHINNPTEDPYAGYPNDPYLTSNEKMYPNFPIKPIDPSQPPVSDQPEIFPSPSIITSQLPNDPQMIPNMIINGGNNQRNNFNSSSMPLTSSILIFIFIVGIMILALSLLFFIRQQQQNYNQNHHKKSSAASTTSASSSASSTAISSLNGAKSHRSHPHTTLQYQHPQHHHHHHLIMSNGSHGGATTTSINHHTLQHNHHHHSASSQSNIYAALVSPTTGNSTTLTNVAPINNNNNLYSNSSTTASHHSSSPSQLANGYQSQNWNQHLNNGQQQIYNQPYTGMNLGGAIENHYTINASSQASYKAGGGSLYNSLGLNCHGADAYVSPGSVVGGPLQTNADWIKLPKVKQFVSKLVNKSLALSGYRACSRDELSNITSDKIYDAFLSYDKRDEAFVMQHLSAELEYGQPQYRVADRFRDLPLPTSAYIAEAITSVIGCSHRTIIVLTENYLASDWCRYELQAALHEASIDKSHKIIAVVLDPKCLLDMDNEMRALLTNCQMYQANNNNTLFSGNTSAQLVQLDNNNSTTSANIDQQQHLIQQQLVATLTTNPNSPGNQQQIVSTQTAQLATSKITFINYNERKFWQKIKQLMPLPRPSTQTLTLTTKN